MQNCILKLEKGMNNNKCNKCFNWDVERAKCSIKLVKSVDVHVKNPGKLSLKSQQKESKKNLSRCSGR